jgi:VWFA-related protein
MKIAACALAAFWCLAPVSAQSPPSAPTPQFQSTVNLVEVDVTVLDKNGRPVTDLTSADFTIKEQGAPQKIQAIYLVTSDSTLLRSLPAAAPTGDDVIVPTRRELKQRFFVFLLDMAHLSPDGLVRSRKAIEAFLKGDTLPDDVFGLVIDGRMLNDHLTPDKAEIVKGLSQANKPNSSAAADRREWPRILDDYEATQIARGDTKMLEQAINRACSEQSDMCRPPNIVDQIILEKARRMATEAQRSALTALQTLQGLVSGLGKMPGVKQVVLFSEGYFIDQAQSRLKEVVGRAAQSNVRISSLDASGLNRNAIGQDFLSATPTRTPGDFATVDVSSDVLTSLAHDTGGMFVKNQNNLAPALETIAQQASTYYVIGYAPASAPDGAYRTIDVSVGRTGVSVRSRHGYLAAATPAPTAPSAGTITAAPSALASAAPTPVSTSTAPVDPNPPAAAVAPPPTSPTTPSSTSAPTSATAASAAAKLRPGGADHVAALAAGAGAPTPAAAKAAQLANEGWDFYSKGDIEHARDRLAESVATAAAPTWAGYALGFSEFALTHYDAAVTAWETVRSRQPEFEPVYFDLADAYLNLGKTSDTVAVLRDAIRRWPNDPEGHNALGVTLVRRGAIDDAINEFHEATLVAPGSSLGFFNLGRGLQLRYSQAQQNASRSNLAGIRSIDDADRQKAIDAFTRYIQLGGPFEKDARDSIAALQWK